MPPRIGSMSTARPPKRSYAGCRAAPKARYADAWRCTEVHDNLVSTTVEIVHVAWSCRTKASFCMRTLSAFRWPVSLLTAVVCYPGVKKKSVYTTANHLSSAAMIESKCVCSRPYYAACASHRCSNNGIPTPHVFERKTVKLWRDLPPTLETELC